MIENYLLVIRPDNYEIRYWIDEGERPETKLSITKVIPSLLVTYYYAKKNPSSKNCEPQGIHNDLT